MKTIDYILNWLKKNLTPKRFLHSLGCAQTARNLALKYELDKNKAYVAGLVHDCAKNLDNEKLLEIIKTEIKTGFDEDELKNPKTYHAIVGAYLIQKEFEIFDHEIINAVRLHTIGSISMSLFDKIIFLADKIEPNTRNKEYSARLIQCLETGIDNALLVCYIETIKSLVDRKLYICPTTIDVYNELLSQTHL